MNDEILKRIRAFEEIRDLQFFVATRLGEDDCCCSTKAVLLERRLSELGLQCRHALCWFTWESLKLPERLLSLPHENLPSHQFLEVLIPETREWAVVDPTWDPGIGSVVPVARWDGITATPYAVPVERLCTPEESAQIFQACESPELMRRYFESDGEFLRELNRFLGEVRGTDPRPQYE